MLFVIFLFKICKTKFSKLIFLPKINNFYFNYLKMNKIKNFKPLLDRCLIKKAHVETKTAGGILLPKASERENRVGEVVATGPGHYNEQGHFIKNRLNVGDFVLLPEYLGTKVELEDKAEYLVYRDSEILATLEKKI